MSDSPENNTDKHLFETIVGDVHSASCHMTKDRRLGVNVGGYVVSMKLEAWFGTIKRENALEVALKANKKKIVALMDNLEEATAKITKLEHQHMEDVGCIQMAEEAIGQSVHQSEVDILKETIESLERDVRCKQEVINIFSDKK